MEQHPELIIKIGSQLEHEKSSNKLTEVSKEYEDGKKVIISLEEITNGYIVTRCVHTVEEQKEGEPYHDHSKDVKMYYVNDPRDNESIFDNFLMGKENMPAGSYSK